MFESLKRPFNSGLFLVAILFGYSCCAIGETQKRSELKVLQPSPLFRVEIVEVEDIVAFAFFINAKEAKQSKDEWVLALDRTIDGEVLATVAIHDEMVEVMNVAEDKSTIVLPQFMLKQKEVASWSVRLDATPRTANGKKTESRRTTWSFRELCSKSKPPAKDLKASRLKASEEALEK